MEATNPTYRGMSAVRTMTPALRQTMGPRSMRLQTLVLLRWLAVIGQTTALIIVDQVFGYALPIGLCFLAIGASALLNIVLRIAYPATKRLGDEEAAAYLAYDMVQLAVLLYLTGGLQNPFAFLFLAPVTISASTLKLRSTLILLALGFTCVSLLAVVHRPLPWVPGASFELPVLYVAGIWGALVLGMAFMATYAWRIADEAEAMSNGLWATQMVLAREQRLSALDGLAAAAAHELGTPLATIVLVAKELQRSAGDNEELSDDLTLLNSQAQRCKEILSTLSNHSAEDAVFSRVSLAAVLDEAAQPYREMNGEITVDVALLDQDESTGVSGPILVRRPEIRYGLGHLIENAVDFALSHVRIQASWTEDDIVVTVDDDGPGFAPDVMDRLGEPYVTTRPSFWSNSEIAESEEEESPPGMGLGFFIAKTLLERTGAKVIIANKPAPIRGAVVTVTWPRLMVEAREQPQDSVV